MRQKYRDMVSEERRKELYEKAMKMYEERSKEWNVDMSKLPKIDGSLTEEDLDKELEKLKIAYLEQVNYFKK